MMKINIVDGRAEVFTDYNADFIAALKKTIGGAKWNPQKGCWIIPAQAVDTCRELMMMYYGETDISVSAERFSVKFYVDAERYCKPIEYFGRILATASGRDSGAKLGKDFELVSGSIDSGGSIKNWTTCAHGVFIAYNITQAQLDNEKLGEDLIEIIYYDKSEIDVSALNEERERLLKRIAEIDELLRQASIS